VRLPALDAAKGIAIVLVVLGHVWSSMIASDRATQTTLHLWFDAYIYTFHVPVFFYISGALMRDPRRPGFFANLARRLMYPYVVWSLFQGLLTAAAGNAAHNTDHAPVSFARVVPNMLFDPIAQFWFLHTLILGMVLIAVAVRLGATARDVLIGSVLLFGLTLVVYHPIVVRSLEKYGLYLAAGFWLGLPKRLPPVWTAVPAFGALALAVSLHLHTIDLVRPALAAIGIAGTLAIAAAWPVQPLCALGRASLAIFMAHVLAAVPARVLPVPLPVLTGTALGLALPYALWRLAEAWSVPIFRWPARGADHAESATSSYAA
jgi:peptidoglycan/LPS O-acetylase OafA/YrhL